MSGKRSKTPDLMGELLTGKAESSPKQRDRQTERQSGGEAERKIKATHYLTEGTLYRLEQALTGLRMATDNRKLNRYDLVEEALRLVLEEWEQAGPESALAQRLRGRG
jgi:hypothetical protein